MSFDYRVKILNSGGLDESTESLNDTDPKAQASIDDDDDIPEQPEAPYLPQLKSHPLTLVLDLDETLIHYNDEENFFLM